MGKIKKIFDFEIVTILTIIILISPFYLITLYTTTTEDIIFKNVYNFFEFQINLEFNKLINNDTTENGELFHLQITDYDDNLLYISGSDVEVLGLLVGFVTVIVNVIAILLNTILYLIKAIILSRNRRVLGESDLENIVIPSYNIIVANTLYTGRIGFYKIYNFFHKQFLEKGLIDKKGKVNTDVNIKELNELEKFFISLYESDVRYETKREFKEKIINELERKRYLKENKVRNYIDYIGNKVETVGRWLYEKDRDDPVRIAIETTLPFAVFLLIAALKYFSIVLIAAIAYIQLKYYNIFLTEDGKKEKAKICILIDELKKKEELTKEEKYFYDVLKFNDL